MLREAVSGPKSIAGVLKQKERPPHVSANLPARSGARLNPAGSGVFFVLFVFAMACADDEPPGPPGLERVWGVFVSPPESIAKGSSGKIASLITQLNLHEPTCTSLIAQPNLHEPTYTSQLARANLHEPTCTANLHEPTCTSQLARANLHSQLTRANLHEPTCTSQLARANLHESTCTSQLIRANLHEPTCPSQLA